jgi:hypothetical protein
VSLDFQDWFDVYLGSRKGSVVSPIYEFFCCFNYVKGCFMDNARNKYLRRSFPRTRPVTRPSETIALLVRKSALEKIHTGNLVRESLMMEFLMVTNDHRRSRPLENVRLPRPIPSFRLSLLRTPTFHIPHIPTIPLQPRPPPIIQIQPSPHHITQDRIKRTISHRKRLPARNELVRLARVGFPERQFREERLEERRPDGRRERLCGVGVPGFEKGVFERVVGVVEVFRFLNEREDASSTRSLIEAGKKRFSIRIESLEVKEDGETFVHFRSVLVCVDEDGRLAAGVDGEEVRFMTLRRFRLTSIPFMTP